MEGKKFGNSSLPFITEDTTVSPRVNLREKIKIEFYKTYDVMTGIRIAATLGGFFSMMILLVLYKNYCKPNKTLSEEQLNAAVTAAAEEEDRALQAALEATSFYTALEKRRESIRNTNQVLLSPRFSSVGGGYSHLTPPIKVMQQRGKSLPGSVMQFGLQGSPSTFHKNEKSGCSSKEEDIDLYSQQLDYFACRKYLNVTPSRRVSSVTCSSADSAYLDRRCSAFELGLPSPSHFMRHSREKLRGEKDLYYPINIQVIQPTPEMSPTASERNLNEEQSGCGLQVPAFHDQMHRLSVTSINIGLAPLASMSSLGSFSSQSLSLGGRSFNTAGINPVENQGCSYTDDSLGSDSVFMDIDEEFATDSEFEYDGFDDDYSFCETKQRPVSRTEMTALQFASFDSFDASIGQDSNSENTEEETNEVTRQSENTKSISFSCRSQSSDLKRHPSLHEGNKVRKKLVKTYSEPRSSKMKRLPMWTEKGYLPKRQMSSPSERKKKFILETESIQNFIRPSDKETRTLITPNTLISQDEENAKDLKNLLLPSSSLSSSTSSVAVTSNTQKPDEASSSSPKQGINKELPLKSTQQLSLLNAQEKRSRLQKQKNFIEEISETLTKTDAQQVTRNEIPRGSSPALGVPVPFPNVLVKIAGEFSENNSDVQSSENSSLAKK